MSATRVGVVGAGTMGAGIAQLAAQGGLEVTIHDPDAEALERGAARIREGLGRLAAGGKISEGDAAAAEARVQPAGELGGLQEKIASDQLLVAEQPPGTEPLARHFPARNRIIAGLAHGTLVIEAAPESLELKSELFARLEAVCGPEAVLATNTSSLSVTAIAAAAERPERIVGMHFFNPPPVMKLVEVVAGEESAEDALAAATSAAEAMGRTPIRARDAIGFVANRCARPFTLESLRMLGEGVASHEEIDRACRLAGGFRMGPFELMDFVGLDTMLFIAEAMYEETKDPRYAAPPRLRQMVAAGMMGRKSGRGFYDYRAKG